MLRAPMRASKPFYQDSTGDAAGLTLVLSLSVAALATPPALPIGWAILGLVLASCGAIQCGRQLKVVSRAFEHVSEQDHEFYIAFLSGAKNTSLLKARCLGWLIAIATCLGYLWLVL